MQRFMSSDALARDDRGAYDSRTGEEFMPLARKLASFTDDDIEAVRNAGPTIKGITS
ncbi:MAG: hypothetical protein NVSMB4_10550 [Acidimicrobiales bacterium]